MKSIKVSGHRKDYLVTGGDAERAQNVILDHLVCEGGEASVSSVVDHMRYKGLKPLPGLRVDQERLIEKLGFTLRPVHKKDTDHRACGPTVVKTMVTV